MKIFIDINHPAHVHYFRNFIRIMKDQGHTFVITNRNEFVINNLLDHYGIEHYTRNKRQNKGSIYRGMLYLLQIILCIIKRSIKEKPDVYVGFASTACAITAYLFNKPCIIIDDTEHNNLNHKLYKRFCSVILTPFYFEKKMGRKQHYFQAFVEQFYLNSSYYEKNDSVLSELNLKPYNYVLIRYIAYDAQHDRKAHPVSAQMKKEIITELSKHYKVLVSCENSVVDEFYAPYLFVISPEKMHDLIAFARYFVSEGATMACEAGLLGTPYLFINPLKVGNVNLQEHLYSHVSQCVDEKEILSVIRKQLSLQWGENERQEIRASIEKYSIDPTQMLINMVLLGDYKCH